MKNKKSLYSCKKKRNKLCFNSLRQSFEILSIFENRNRKKSIICRWFDAKNLAPFQTELGSTFQCLHCDVTNDVTCSKINNFWMIDSYRRFLNEYCDLWSRALAVAPAICAGRDQDANELLIDVFVNAVRAYVTQTNRKRRAARHSGSATSSKSNKLITELQKPANRFWTHSLYQILACWRLRGS